MPREPEADEDEVEDYERMGRTTREIELCAAVGARDAAQSRVEVLMREAFPVGTPITYSWGRSILHGIVLSHGFNESLCVSTARSSRIVRRWHITGQP